MENPRTRFRRRSALIAVAALLAVAPAACSSDSDDDATSTTEAPADGGSTTEAPAEEPSEDALQILVTNDDGYDAEGIDELVSGLQSLPDVEITVVAPLEQQSGTGGKETDGPVESSEVELPNGLAATAVDGFPSDAVRVAIDEMGLEPDLVVSGINEGQNIGPVVDLSGTIGAARAGARRGIPALALSQGLDATIADYQVTVPLVLDWIQDNRAAILDGTAEVGVTSINVPTCTAGAVRGLAETEVDPAADPATALGPQDCESTTPSEELEGDVALFLQGFATITEVPIEPGS